MLHLKAPKLGLSTKLERNVDCRKYIKSYLTTIVFHLSFVANFILARNPLLAVLHCI